MCLNSPAFNKCTCGVWSEQQSHLLTFPLEFLAASEGGPLQKEREGGGSLFGRAQSGSAAQRPALPFSNSSVGSLKKKKKSDRQPLVNKWHVGEVGECLVKDSSGPFTRALNTQSKWCICSALSRPGRASRSQRRERGRGAAASGSSGRFTADKAPVSQIFMSLPFECYFPLISIVGLERTV